MTPSEVAIVLTKCAAYDQRTIGEADVRAWHEILEHVDLADALDAVRRHFRLTSNRAWPADILRHAGDAKRDRQRTERSSNLALPSKWEPTAGPTAKPAFDRTADIRAEARQRIAEAQAKAAALRKAYDKTGDAMAELDRVLANLNPPAEDPQGEHP